MAPHKQPRSLLDSAHRRYASLILASCVSIERRCGDYDSQDCVRTISELQRTLATILPTPLWNGLCELLLAVAKNSLLKDLRIVYALFANDKLTRVHVSSINAWSNTQRQVSNLFWEDVFAKIGSRVTEIVLDGNFDKGSLAAIGDHCHDLEAIVLPYNVSLEVIASLLKCTKLRRIQGRHWCYFHVADFRRFVRSLPELEYVDVPNLIECFADLEEDEEQPAALKLAYLCVLRPTATPKNVAMVTRLCPALRHLQIDFRSRDECATILDILADSSVNLSSFTMWSHFPASQKCRRFFTGKGVHLLHLKLIHCQSSVTYAMVRMIAECCPNLESLDIDVTRSQSDRDSVEVCRTDHVVAHSIFKNLKSLGLEDWGGERDWDPRIVEMCMTNATNLETLSLVNVYKCELTVDRFRVLFDPERTSRLVDVKLKMGPLTAPMVSCVYENCGQLRSLALRDPVDKPTEQYLNNLKLYVTNNNIDLTLDYFVIKDR